MAEPARRGRPRSEKARAAILAATTELLLDRGLAAVSMDAVAARAGVSKATIYRWWPTKEALALDAVYLDWATAQQPDDGSGPLREDLRALLRPWVRLIRSRPYGRVVTGLLAHAQTDPAFAEDYVARFVEPRREQARALFLRAVERGEIRPDTHTEVALDLLYGALYHRMLNRHLPLTDRFVADAIDLVVRGVSGGDCTAT